MRPDDATLLDIHTAVGLAMRFVEGYDRAAFFDDPKTQAAVLHELMVIGGAVKRLSLEFRLVHPEFPWHQIAGMRDKLIHAYDAVDVDQVWRTLKTDLPSLQSFLKSKLKEQER